MRRTPTLTLSAILAFAPSVPASAQADAAHPIRTSVEVVAADVEVLVLDAKGRPVDSLAKTDFRLFVNGKETPIDWFDAPPSAVAPSTAPARAAGAPAAPLAPSRRLHSTVFVISDLQVDLRARNAGLETLRAYVDRMPEGEEGAVYLLDNGVRRLQGFTPDRKALKAALAKPAKTLPRSYVFSEAHGDEWVGQSRQLLRNFATVLDSVANRPEAKTVVVLAGAISPSGLIAPVGGAAGSGAMGQTTFSTNRDPLVQAETISPKGGAGTADAALTNPLGISESVSSSGNALGTRGVWSLLAEAKDAEAEALLAKVTVIGLDPSGLGSAGAQADTNAEATDLIAASDPWEFRNDAFAMIATATGGARLGFSNKPVDLLTTEANLLARRYRLGFTPPDATSARRDIRVEVARPGLVVRTAHGQRSLTPGTAARARFAALLLSAEAPKGDFPIALETKGPVKNRKDDAFPFDVVVPVSGVYAEERGDTRRAKLELLIAGVDEEGRASEPMVIPFSVTLDKSAADGAFFRKDANFALDHRWKGRLFVGVRDTATSRLGAVALPIGG